jgi:molecular chaperone DnaK
MQRDFEKFMSNPTDSSTPRKAVGIDLGTTFSAIAHIDAYGKPQIIPNAESERITPSVILFDGHNAIVGTMAKQNAVAEPEKIVDFVKREMGKSKAQFHREFNGKIYSAEELSALIRRNTSVNRSPMRSSRSRRISMTPRGRQRCTLASWRA